MVTYLTKTPPAQPALVIVQNPVAPLAQAGPIQHWTSFGPGQWLATAVPPRPEHQLVYSQVPTKSVPALTGEVSMKSSISRFLFISFHFIFFMFFLSLGDGEEMMTGETEREGHTIGAVQSSPM
jgi:hypothetical protein